MNVHNSLFEREQTADVAEETLFSDEVDVVEGDDDDYDRQEKAATWILVANQT